MTVRLPLGWAVVILLGLATGTHATDVARQTTGADAAMTTYGVSGAGVIVAILDRGVDITHPGFRHEDGSTRIRYLLDMSGQNGCTAPVPMPVEYSAAQIDAALQGGPPVNSRDAVGHGTVTAGIAAGNGRGHPTLRYRGFAPQADLIVVKLVSEGAPAHGSQPAEAAFQGCILDALDWLDGKLNELQQPCVAIINSGTQWGPMDGTSIVSRKIDDVFGNDRPGRVFVIPSGDEGTLPTHSGGVFSSSSPATVSYTKFSSATGFVGMYYTGATPANISVVTPGGTTVGPVGPGGSLNQSGVWIINYQPGTEFYPWLSDGGDRAVWIRITTATGTGQIIIDGLTPTQGRFDMYHGQLPNVLRFNNLLVPGRLTDYATTSSGIIVGAHVNRTAWINLLGALVTMSSEGGTGQLWTFSSAGPTRDGRRHGVDVTAPGHNIFAAYAPNSWYATVINWLIQDGGGIHGRLAATSGAAPIVTGAVALMLEANPNLTADQARAMLRASGVADGSTGALPNLSWGFGKVNVLDAVRRAVLSASGDLNLDGSINGIDLALLLGQWTGAGFYAPCPPHQPADLNLDCRVNGLDLAILLGAWTG